MKQSKIFIYNNRIDYNKDGIKISKEMKGLLEKILERDPKKRLTAKEISEDKWLNQK